MVSLLRDPPNVSAFVLSPFCSGVEILVVDRLIVRPLLPDVANHLSTGRRRLLSFSVRSDFLWLARVPLGEGREIAAIKDMGAHHSHIR
jgi:hypothetical protein